MSAGESLAAHVAALPEAERAAFLDGLSGEEAAALLYCWRFWARPEQIAPDHRPWETWLLLAGRGFGKTRTGAEWVRAEVENGRRRRLALVGPTARDVRKTMVEGDSGILAIAPPWFRPRFEPSKSRLTWPNGATADLYSAEEPERLRGPNHDGAWVDELAAWAYLDETWDNLELTLRGGEDPKRVVTTTPKPRKVLRDLLADPHTAVIRGSTYDNAPNLAPAFLKRLERKYEGTRTGRQELHAELLEEAEGALWSRARLEAARVAQAPAMKRVVVAIDPAVTSDAGSDETGIVVAGLGSDDVAYVLADLSGRYGPDQWARRAVEAYRAHRADRIVAEVNNGGELVQHTIRTVDRDVAFKAVHASRGKRIRAEPVAALYEQDRVKHVGALELLEDQMTNWDPLGEARSPDRLDACVWALSELMLETGPSGLIDFYAREVSRLKD
ncbi:MAG TPA: terminase family protein [Alphaproteobacteria bacterium]|nr:terminase family protein [Alphaproteobacteria bacterium]